MSEVTQVQVEEALQQYVVPHLNKNVLVADALKSISIDGGMVTIVIELGFAVASIKAAMQKAIVGLVSQIPGVENVSVEISWAIASIKGQRDMRNMDSVKNIIAVASGKGGVGKSTTSVNLALALAKDGAKVGLLDADIYGPSQQMMLGVDASARPESENQQYLSPIEAHGLKTMSMGYLVTDKTPMVWRGPMAGGALNQLLAQTWWGELDYLIIDMPPGTGDIQLTLSQKAAVAGAVIVTTPQDIALMDAQKGIEMFTKVEVPVLGVVENMAIHICSACGHKEHVFGDGGGSRIAEEYKVPLLGSLPLSLKIRQQVDAGAPTVVAEPESDEALLYGEIARDMAVQLAGQGSAGPAFPNIVINND
ncbi:MAG: iron-sulfur cluster carrier protein ApbC [Oceanicoccus sp.]|uniref:iron-sulfur cluster carrier protein ApbC n=1 Tax=Oceanicoccus sp. TaxID=2691044 RepID=UPI0026279705|nr:iron-sulfur cluster carrier protein ApbC [Oceanicoccus sp.]MCP3907670.1 iron-sulfur cluster carrier protein ApbC [Oceanicoccus sp.]